MACDCDGNSNAGLVYACSGAANTGLLADQVMRALNRDRIAASTCLAGIGAELSGFVESARSATGNMVLDGCPVACGKKIFEAKGLPYEHFLMTDFGVEKGKTEITGDLIASVVARMTERIAFRIAGQA